MSCIHVFTPVPNTPSLQFALRQACAEQLAVLSQQQLQLQHHLQQVAHQQQQPLPSHSFIPSQLSTAGAALLSAPLPAPVPPSLLKAPYSSGPSAAAVTGGSLMPATALPPALPNAQSIRKRKSSAVAGSGMSGACGNVTGSAAAPASAAASGGTPRAKVKRAVTSKQLYVNRNRTRSKKQFPDGTPTKTITKRLHQEWDELSDGERAEWEVKGHTTHTLSTLCLHTHGT